MLPMKRMMLSVGAAALIAGCATTGNLRSSADRLEQRAEDLTREVRVSDERHDYRRDARAFADEAQDFRRVVAERGNDSRYVRDAFHDLSARYHALRDAAGDSEDAGTLPEFRAVTDAYLDVERAVEGNRHSRERYSDTRY